MPIIKYYDIAGTYVKYEVKNNNCQHIISC